MYTFMNQTNLTFQRVNLDDLDFNLTVITCLVPHRQVSATGILD